MSTPGTLCTAFGVAFVASLGSLAAIYLDGGSNLGARWRGKSLLGMDGGPSLHPHVQYWR
jgi:hypothetical protein